MTTRAARPIDCQLVGFEVENLRGFRKATLALERDTTFLVGPNNSGKTSLLRLLDWALNKADDELLTGNRGLRVDEEQLLLPARNTRGTARRLVLRVWIPDGRTGRRFAAADHVARLRFQVVRRSLFVKVSPPRRNEQRSSERKAVELLNAVRERTALFLVPSARSADSDRFRESLTAAVRARLAERALHRRRGGAPAEYRTVKGALDDLEGVVRELLAPLWKSMTGVLIPGLAKVGGFSLAADPEALISWLVSQIEFSLSTGSHDQRRVRPTEVGSGLQSLLDVALVRTGLAELEGESGWLLVEEPEAFLHPSAQRSIATSLRQTDGPKKIISTHSPLIVEEAEYGEIVLVRNHRIFEPNDVDDHRVEINTAFQTGLGAEALFSRSVLLVEGPGDRAFFEVLRRRLAKTDPSGLVNTLMVVDVGGKSRFAPWIRLFRSYADDTELPVRWAAVVDAVDGSAELARGVREAGVSLPAAVDVHFRRLPRLYREGQLDAAIEESSELNAAALEAGARVAVAPVDLEYLMLAEASAATCARIANRVRCDRRDRVGLLGFLGSKFGDGPIADPAKAPWIRSVIGQELRPHEISEDVRAILRIWMRGAMDDEQITALLGRFE